MATKISELEKKRAAKEFANYWKGKGYEKGQSQKYWIELLGNVFGVEDATRYIEFEDKVKMDNTSFIDGYIPETKVLIEQKSIEKDLQKPIRQSDGTYLSAFTQAKKYSAELPYSRRPRWIITCNFKEFFIYDMENPNAEPEKLLLKDLPKEYYRLSFLVDTKNEFIKKEMKVSIDAGEIVGHIYDEIKKQYIDPDSPESLRSLNILCVRLVFCLYAEDAGVFNRLLFHDFIKGHNAIHLNEALEKLFEVLNTRKEDLSPYLSEDLKAFPFVNGGLFEDKDNQKIIIPHFTEELKQYLINDASEGFDWSEISPTIFGAVFESTLNPETRREGGMHYTSIENIHKVIDPLFLNDLRDELEELKLIKQDKLKREKMEEYREKLASLKFLDPACGSGNFLTETYLSLRMLENEAIKEINQDQIIMEEYDPIKVNIEQFYGIEINDFAVDVAKAALWIAEHQMKKKTEEIIGKPLKYLPLKTNAYIREGNALKIDWNEVVNKTKLNYIMGNPPFVGAMMSKGAKREDIENAFPECKMIGQVDYVSGWYVKAAKMITDTQIKCAFVSTNSICQGQQVSLIWRPMIEQFGMKIDYAYHTFIWDSEASIKAHVHCVIVGFSDKSVVSEKYIFDNGKVKKATNINGYLHDAPNAFIESRNKAICNIPPIRFGSMARDGGNLFFSEEEYKDQIKKEPISQKWLHQFLGATEFLNNKKRYCLWMVGYNPSDLNKCPKIKERIELVRNFRLNSKADSTRKFAETPMLFCQIAQPNENYILVPRHSSKRRKYIPFGYCSSDIICGDANLLIPSASLFHFGIIQSNAHMAWMRVVAGRIKSDYRYSKDIVYNNFPWCNPTAEQKAKIEKTAQAILDARALYPDSSLADLYDELTMPPELRKAHQANDKAVMQAYGFSTKMTESECVAELMKMYSELVENQH